MLGKGVSMFLEKSVLCLVAVGIFGSFAVKASAQVKQISQQSSPPSGASRPAWMTPSDDPTIRVCQFTAFAIKVGMDERREGLTVNQSISRWNGLLLERRESATNIALMISGLRTAHRYEKIDYSVPENFYYDCILRMAER